MTFAIAQYDASEPRLTVGFWYSGVVDCKGTSVPAIFDFHMPSQV